MVAQDYTQTSSCSAADEEDSSSFCVADDDCKHLAVTTSPGPVDVFPGSDFQTGPTDCKRAVHFHAEVRVKQIPIHYELSQAERNSLYVTALEKMQSRNELRSALQQLAGSPNNAEDNPFMRGLEVYEASANRERRQRIARLQQAVLMQQSRSEGLSEDWLNYIYREMTATSAWNAHKRGLMDQQFDLEGPPRSQIMLR